MKKICLWASPRNVSTAFMYSFSQRTDTIVIDEPYYGYYLKNNNINHPGQEEILNTVEYNQHNINHHILNYNSKKDIIYLYCLNKLDV